MEESAGAKVEEAAHIVREDALQDVGAPLSKTTEGKDKWEKAIEDLHFTQPLSKKSRVDYVRYLVRFELFARQLTTPV